MKSIAAPGLAAACVAALVVLARADARLVATAAAATPTPPAPTVSVTTLPALPTAPPETPRPAYTPTGPAFTPSPLPPLSSPLPAIGPPPTIPPGTAIMLAGIAQPRYVTLKDLQNMRRTSLTLRVIDPDGRHRVHTYSGVLLRDLLEAGQAQPLPPAVVRAHRYVTVTDVSGQSVVLAYAEFDQDLENKQVIIAYVVDGNSPAKGIATLVVPGDATTARFLEGVTRIAVAAAGP